MAEPDIGPGTGMRKRAALARAIALDPELLFLDEPEAQPLIAELRELTASLRRFSGELEGNPAVLIHGRPPAQPASGCAGLQAPPAQPLRIYVLEAPGAVAREAPAPIVSVRARPGFDTAQMAYVRRPHELEYFANNRWADAPARMLAPLIAQACRARGQLRLDAELVRLVQDFTVRPSRVRLTLRVELSEADSKRLLVARELDEVEEVASDDPYGGVLAANRALARLLGRVGDICG